MSTGTALILVLSGVAIGWTLRWPFVDRADRRVAQLEDDLAYLTEQAAARSKAAHPAGKTMRVVR